MDCVDILAMPAVGGLAWVVAGLPLVAGVLGGAWFAVKPLTGDLRGTGVVGAAAGMRSLLSQGTLGLTKGFALAQGFRWAQPASTIS